jgi:acyl-CoA thioesterase I
MTIMSKALALSLAVAAVAPLAVVLFVEGAPSAPATPAPDPAGLSRYRGENARLPAPRPGERRVVFMGDSITEGWVQSVPSFFAGKPYVGRGISGQTTQQMLARFLQDVLDLKAAVVVILAGTNDIAGNSGPYEARATEKNLSAMCELARSKGVRVVVASVLPAFDYPWRPGLTPAPKIVALNAFLENLARRRGYVYLDYHGAMTDAKGGLRPELSPDGVHPNAAGYSIMGPLAEKAIAEALGGSRSSPTSAP